MRKGLVVGTLKGFAKQPTIEEPKPKPKPKSAPKPRKRRKTAKKKAK